MHIATVKKFTFNKIMDFLKATNNFLKAVDANIAKYYSVTK